MEVPKEVSGVGCQAVWHDMNEPVPPWKGTLDEEIELSKIASQYPNISRTDAQRVLQGLPPKKGNFKPSQGWLGFDDDEKPVEGIRIAGKNILLDLNMSPLAVVNEVFQRLGAAPVDATEFAQIIAKSIQVTKQHVADTMKHTERKKRSRKHKHQSDDDEEEEETDGSRLPEGTTPPLVTAIERLADFRGLEIEDITKTEKPFAAENFVLGDTAMIFVDRNLPRFVAAVPVPYKGGHKKKQGRTSEHDEEGVANSEGHARQTVMLDVISPIHDPIPFRMHITNLNSAPRGSFDLLLLRNRQHPFRSRHVSQRAKSKKRFRPCERDEWGSLPPNTHKQLSEAALFSIPSVAEKALRRDARRRRVAWHLQLMRLPVRMQYRVAVAALQAEFGDQ